jgi:Hemerythrin HHE cation binding domain
MSIIDKVVAAVTPPESDEARREARATAMASATPGDWLSMVLEHHQAIEAAFVAVSEASTSAAQVAAQKKLALILTGHSVAEEAVLYPALADAGEKGHATMAYTEQSAAKMQMGLLEKLQPQTQDYLDKLEHIRGAVAHHVYEEEGNWFLDIKNKVPPAEQDRLAARYLEEFSAMPGVRIFAPGTAGRSPHINLCASFRTAILARPTLTFAFFLFLVRILRQQSRSHFFFSKLRKPLIEGLALLKCPIHCTHRGFLSDSGS